MRKRLSKKDSDKFDPKNYEPNRKPYKKDADSAKKSFGDKKKYGERRDSDQSRGRSSDKRKSFNEDRRGGGKFDNSPRNYGSGDKRKFGNSDHRDSDKKQNHYKDRDKSFSRGDKKGGFGEDRFEGKKKHFGDKKRSFSRDDRRGGRFEKDKHSFISKPQKENPKYDGGDIDKPSFKKFGAKKSVDENIIKKSLDRQVGAPTPPRFDENKVKARLPQKVQQKIDTTKKEDEIRLNKYIANAGLCSRREADELIESGMIKVNGKVVTEMGYKVKPNDTVKYGKDILSREKMMYVLLNKPKDFITTMDDPKERRTVMELVAGACKERIYPVGRLDRNTTGLLLLTNDGELTEKLTHPSSELTKIYQAELDKPFQEEDFEKLKEGVELEDGFIQPDELAMVTPDGYVVGLKIHSGKNRVVRRMFEHLGYEVTKLDRTTFAGLTKKDLPRGKWRFLNEKEIIRLKYLI